MIKRDPQEIADFFGCKVQVNPCTNNVFLWDSSGDIRGCVGYLDHQIVPKSNMVDGKLTYEPKGKKEKSEGNSPNSENKGGPCYQDFADSDNNAPHQSEVHVNSEYKTVTGYSLPEFDRKVNDAISEGWKPLSMAIFPVVPSIGTVYYMAMVRGRNE